MEFARILRMFSPRIKILFVHSSLEYGGAEDQRLTILKHINRDKYDISICCLEKIGDIGKQIEKIGFRVDCLNMPAKPYNIPTTFSLFRYLLKNRCDIVQTSLFATNFHGRIAAKLAGIPHIISEEHSEHYQYTTVKSLPYIWADKILALFTDRIICCSKKVMDSISELEGLPRDKFQAILSVVNFSKLEITIDKKKMRYHLGLNDSDVVLGNIASISPRKGHAVLIKAFKLMRESLPSAKLVIAGNEDANTKAGLLKLIKELNLSKDIIFLGKQEKLANVFNVMDIFILSSFIEGIPLAVIEAMYMNIPVIATDVGGLREIIKDGETGVIVPSNDPQAMAKAVQDLLSNPNKIANIVRDAKTSAIARFVPQRYVLELEKCYETIISNRLHK